MIEASGLVANVYPDAAGVVVVADAAATDVTLNVRDASDLVNYPAGLLLLPDDTLAAYESPPVFGPAADPDVVTLTAGLPADLTAEIALDLYETDVDGDAVPVVTYWATVLLDNGDIQEAIVDPHWITQLKVGIRDVGRQERVIVERASELDEWQLRRPVRRVPKLDLAFARRQSLPTAAIAPGQIDVPLVLTHVQAGGFSYMGGVGELRGADGSLAFDGTYSNPDTIDERLDLLESGLGGSGTGGISIDCGGPAAAGVSIDCGGP